MKDPATGFAPEAGSSAGGNHLHAVPDVIGIAERGTRKLTRQSESPQDQKRNATLVGSDGRAFDPSTSLLWGEGAIPGQQKLTRRR
jgi:hypothetical protein